MSAITACLIACWAGLVTPRLVQVDFAEHRLPNAIVLPGWLVAAIALCATWLLTGAFPGAALGLGLGIGAGALVVAFTGGLGMGDVKLIVPLAIGLGLHEPSSLLIAGLVAILGGGIAALVTLIRGRRADAHIAFGPWLLLGFWTAYVA